MCLRKLFKESFIFYLQVYEKLMFSNLFKLYFTTLQLATRVDHRTVDLLVLCYVIFNRFTDEQRPFQAFKAHLTRFDRPGPEIGQVDKITRNETKLERRKSQNPAPRLRRSITVNNFQDIQTVAQVMIFNKKKLYGLFKFVNRFYKK